ncbi:MAG TPA: benzoate-CoA ligase family protein [Casimicrobiaceae bacterium]|nr:benzoate-CoA ligase family protein [Casimicrobiaceae bacterium]
MSAHGNPPPERFNFAQDVLERNAGRAGKTAYVDDVVTLTYGELDARVRSAAAAYVALGLRREERLLLCLHDTVDFPVAFLGALYAGVVPVAVNTMLTADDYAYMLSHSRARALVVSGVLLPALVEALGRGGHDVQNVIVSRAATALPESALDFAAWIGAAAAMPRAVDTAAEEMAFWLYSSGSTGRPKGTVHTHANLHWTAELYGKPILGLNERDVVFSAAKLFFAYGLGNALTFPLSVGATTVLMAERATPQAVFLRFLQHQPTIFCGVPTLYAALLSSPDLPQRKDVALRRCISAGEALPREVGERFAARFGCEILDGIGSTEMLHIFLSNQAGHVRYGTTGRPVPGYEVELRGEDGHVVGDDAIGDLYIRGPSAALMYWQSRERSRATFQGEWTKSGDKYTRSADGYYTYAGRSDDMLKVSGQYVSPFEVEAVLMRHETVLEAAVVGKVDHDGLTRAIAYVVLKPGHGGDAELAQALQAFVKGQLAPHKYPREVHFLPELPKTATGKIQRFKLRDPAAH